MLRDEIEERGFSIVSEVVERGEMDRLIAQLAHEPLLRSRAGARHALSHPAVLALAADPRLLGLAQEVLGGEPFPFRATFFEKSRNSNWLVVWHQDTALPLQQRRDLPGWGPWSVKAGVTYAHAPSTALCRILALRVHLDNSTAENGPLRVLPGTHRLGVLTDDEIEKLAGDLAPVECLIARGGILLMRPLIVHASSKSKVSVSRRVLHIEYAASAAFDDGLLLAMA